jgi:nicotinamide riboside transporter PnuC
MTFNVGLQVVITLVGLSACVTCILKRRICWALWSLSNVGWVWLYLRTGLEESIPIVVIYTIVNIWGWIQWTKDKKGDKK